MPNSFDYVLGLASRTAAPHTAARQRPHAYNNCGWDTLISLSGDEFSPQTGAHGPIGSLSSCRMILPTSRDREFLRSHSGLYP
jgi:hypothetical protein